ncbi:MAG: WH2 domain-containing protein [Candidatus Aquirickettsiella gammari]
MQKKTVHLMKKLVTDINYINSELPFKSTLIYSASKDFFDAVNKLGKEELKACLRNLDIDKENINANSVTFKIVSCLLVFTIEKYSKDEFLRFVHPLCTDPNNNGNLINKIEVKKSKWKVIRWLQGILSGFKREKFVINSEHSSAAAFECAYRALKSKSKKISLEDYIRLSQQDESFSRSLSSIIEKIFSIAPPQDQAETWPPLPEPSQLFIEGEAAASNNLITQAPLPPPSPLLQASKESYQSNMEASYLESAVTAVNVKRPPLQRENNVTIPSFTSLQTELGKQREKLKKVDVNARGNSGEVESRDAMLNAIRKGLTLRKVDHVNARGNGGGVESRDAMLQKRKEGINSQKENSDSVLSKEPPAKNSLQKYDEENTRTKDLKQILVEGLSQIRRFHSESSQSSSSSQYEFSDESSDSEQASSQPCPSREEPKLTKGSSNDKISDSGHGSLSSLDSEKELETFKEMEFYKGVNEALFKPTKESGPEKHEKQLKVFRNTREFFNNK